MTTNALKTLLHPFEAGVLDLPSAGQRALFLGAPGETRLPAGFAASLTTVQGFRPDFLALQARGMQVAPRAEGTDYDIALVLCGRHKTRNRLQMAEALERVRPGAELVVAGLKDDGIASLRREIAELGGGAVDGVSKHHGQVFWLRAGPSAPQVAALLRAKTPSGEYTAFAAGRIDDGSALLASRLPETLSGRVADFCAGGGHLAAAALARSPRIRQLDLYEADYDSLETARARLSGSATPLTFLWHDLLSEPVGAHYDAIVMNPPFHVSRKADPALGKAMIAAAAKATRPGGRLFMVANRHLPYEATLQEKFASFEEIGGDGRFKLISARR
jgi:16S rRNA (guanine1207-N2)-methyltransferase